MTNYASTLSSGYIYCEEWLRVEILKEFGRQLPENYYVHFINRAKKTFEQKCYMEFGVVTEWDQRLGLVRTNAQINTNVEFELFQKTLKEVLSFNTLSYIIKTGGV